MRDFASQEFRPFDGTQGLLLAEAWITDIQLLHETLGFIDEQKVRYTGLRITRKLQDGGNRRKNSYY